MTAEALDGFSQLITTAPGLVAAPAWNTATRRPFDDIFGQAGEEPAAEFFYAALATPTGVFATIPVSRAAERAEKTEKAERERGGLFGRSQDRGRV